MDSRCLSIAVFVKEIDSIFDIVFILRDPKTNVNICCDMPC